MLRDYVEARTSTAAPLLTTSELRAELERAGEWPAERVNDLIAILETCDLVKFASDQLTPNDRDRMLAKAHAIVSNRASRGDSPPSDGGQ